MNLKKKILIRVKGAICAGKVSLCAKLGCPKSDFEKVATSTKKFQNHFAQTFLELDKKVQTQWEGKTHKDFSRIQIESVLQKFSGESLLSQSQLLL